MNSEKTILLVEDEAITAKLEKQQLEKYGYTVRHINNGEKAIETVLIDNTHVDLILMDIDLGSGIDGTQAAEEILKRKDIPIVFLSSHSESEIVEKTEKITSYGYVVKNSGIVVLDASIKMAFKLFKANKKVTKSNNLLTNLAALVPGVIYQFRLYPDGSSSFPYSSPGMYDIYEVTPDEVMEDASKVYTRLHPEDYDNVVYLINRSAETLETFYCEFRVILPEKGLRWRWSQANPERMKDGSILWHGIISDITERKLAEIKLKETNSLIKDVKNKLDYALSTSNIGAWELDLIDHTAWRSLTHDNIFGYDTLLTEWTFEMFIEHIFPDDRSYVIEKFNSAVSNKKEWDFECRVIRKNGEMRWIWVKGIPGYDNNENPKKMFGIVQDITEHKNRENELKERIDAVKNKLMIENGKYSLFISDEIIEKWQNIITIMAKILNVPAGLIMQRVGPNIQVFLSSKTENNPYKPGDKEHFEDSGLYCETVIKTNKMLLVPDALSDEKWKNNPDIKLNMISYLGFPIKLPDNTPFGTICVLDNKKNKHSDIFINLISSFRDTIEKDLELIYTNDTLHDNNIKLNKLLTEKEILLKEVHHRVKNNIANIEILLFLQADSSDNSEVKTALQDAISRVQSIRILYDKLLLSKDYYDISIKSYTGNLIDSFLSVFDIGKNISIEKQIREFNIISKQAIAVGIIINELLTNAFKYAFKGRDNGKIFISINKNENLVTLIIHDNGIGIDERIDADKSPGFGLTIVKMLVEQLNVTYSIANENGTKSVIEFEM